MKDFLFVFRADPSKMPQGTPEERKAITQTWMDWMASISAKNMLGDRGNRLGSTGKVVRPNNVITNGPYTEIKETIGGYTMIKAESYEDAVELAKGCPILKFGGNVEVRETNPL